MNMTARFKAYRDLNREIDLQIERLEQMEAKAGSPSTPNLSGMPKGSSFQHDRMADTVARIADLRSEIDSLIAERDAEQKALEALIRRLPNADRRLVLRLRYLDSEEWEDVLFIAYGGKPDFNEKYDNYKQRVFRHHKQALAELEDKTAVFLRIRALTHALDMIFSNADDGLSEDANTISMMLVELVDKYDRMRTAEAE